MSKRQFLLLLTWSIKLTIRSIALTIWSISKFKVKPIAFLLTLTIWSILDNTDYLNINPFSKMQNFPRLCYDIFLSMKSGPKHRLFNWLEFFDHLMSFFKKAFAVYFHGNNQSISGAHCTLWERFNLFGNVQALPFQEHLGR